MAAKAAEVAPAATVTLAGTLKAGALLDSEIVAPPEPAALDRVTVQLAVSPVERLAGPQLKAVRTVAATSESEAVCEPPLKLAVITTVPSVAMAPAVAVKVAEVAPAATVTVGGTVSAAALLDSETTAPPAPAALLRLTLQVAVPDEDRLVGAQPSAAGTVGASSETDVCCEPPPKVAVTTAVWSLVIVPAVAVKPALLDPAVTVTEPGTLNPAVLLDSKTDALPGPAALDRVTVQLAVSPDERVDGAHVSELNAAGAESREKEAVCEVPFRLAVITAG